MSQNPLTDTEIKDIAQKLKKLSPGYLPFDLFVEFTRLKVTVTLEFFLMCFGPDGKIYVVLFQRPADDLWWPGLYHTPGVCLLPEHIPENDEWGLPTRAFEKLKNDELKDIKLIGDPYFAGCINHQVKRGAESDQVYIQKVDYTSALSHLFAVDSLPQNTISHHIDMIKKCADIFKNKLY